MYKICLSTLLMFYSCFSGYAQQAPAVPSSPILLPGKGLAQHDFFYSGEGNHKMSIVRKGQIIWTYTDTTQHGEISDATLLSNGNILFTRQKGISLISPDKKLLWDYASPPNTEIHTAQPIGNSRVIFGLDGNPAKIVVINLTSGKTELEFPVVTKNLTYIHGQFRHISLTDAGTVLLANLDMDKVSEYDASGKEIWSVPTPHPWYAIRLKNGNTLITGYKSPVREITPQGETVWQFDLTDVPGIKLSTFQTVSRLANGNTVISNSGAWADTTAVQAIEVTPAKKLVWALRSWDAVSGLGRGTTIQILDGPQVPPEKKHFGGFR